MRKFKRLLTTITVLAALALLVGACDDTLDVFQAYGFDLFTMPVQESLREGETAEIRCTLVRDGEYKNAEFFIRMFQPNGEGELKMDNGTLFLPNDLYPLGKTTFRLYYTSHCSDQQTIDVYIQDNFGQVVQKTFSFQNKINEE
ncbi:MAG: DUF3872 domain-containing protein [Mariniphaga sp.]|nr:DUF3872 domain-containing protein [Mariniphaga sp.]MDD4757076.1 DUF3872 domain-containing protein [Prolixibacteraceae bacterium]